MTIPVKFRKEREASIASYDYIDIANATGYENYYAARLSGAYLNNYVLTSEVIYSSPIETTGWADASGAYLVNNLDFDIEFKLPRVIRGKATVTAPIEILWSSIAARAYNSYFDAALYVVTGSTETLIVSGSSAIINLPNDTASYEEIKSIALEVPQTQIRKNDKLRLTIQQYGWGLGHITRGYYTVAHDPKNRDGTNITTIDTNLILTLPFKIDL